MKAMLEPRIVAARTHRAVARVQGDGSVARRIASSHGPRAATFIAGSGSPGYAERTSVPAVVSIHSARIASASIVM
jgi:hypothetical protein